MMSNWLGFLTSFLERGYEKAGFIRFNDWVAGTLFAFLNAGILFALCCQGLA